MVRCLDAREVEDILAEFEPHLGFVWVPRGQPNLVVILGHFDFCGYPVLFGFDFCLLLGLYDCLGHFCGGEPAGRVLVPLGSLVVRVVAAVGRGVFVLVEHVLCLVQD